MANPFAVNVPNALEALMLGQGAYEKSTQKFARNQAAEALQSGNTQDALARLIGMGDIQSATAIGNLTNQQFQRGIAERQMALQERQALDKPQFQKDDLGNIVRIEPNGTARVVYKPDYSTPGGPQIPPGVNPKEFVAARSKQLGNIDDKAILESDKAVQAGSNAVRDLGRALELNSKAYSGPFARERGYVASQFGSQAGADTELLSNIVTNQALENLRATFGGNPTEGERKILLDVQGAASQAPEVRKRIYENAIETAKSRVEFNRRTAEQMRSGTYLLPAGQRQQMQSQPAQPQSTPQGSPVKVSTPQERDALAPGTPYLAPDGQVRIKQ